MMDALQIALRENKQLQDQLRYPHCGLSILPVQQFMQACDQPSATFTTSLLYRELVEEECVNELFKWFKHCKTVRNGGTVYDEKTGLPLTLEQCRTEVFDGGLDTIYTVVGLLEGMGFPVVQGWNEVCRSNLSKIQPDGKVLKDPVTGKVQKPQGYSKPNLEQFL